MLYLSNTVLSLTLYYGTAFHFLSINWVVVISSTLALMMRNNIPFQAIVHLELPVIQLSMVFPLDGSACSESKGSNNSLAKKTARVRLPVLSIPCTLAAILKKCWSSTIRNFHSDEHVVSIFLFFLSFCLGYVLFNFWSCGWVWFKAG